MNQFQLHPDGFVIVRVAGQIYIDTGANFASDHGVAAPALPAGTIGVLYDKDAGTVFATTGLDQIEADASFKTFGDAAIAAVASLMSAQQARTAAAIAAAEPKLPEPVAVTVG